MGGKWRPVEGKIDDGTVEIGQQNKEWQGRVEKRNVLYVFP